MPGLLEIAIVTAMVLLFAGTLTVPLAAFAALVWFIGAPDRAVARRGAEGNDPASFGDPGFCQECRRLAPLGLFTLQRHQGMINRFVHTTLSGWMCADCVQERGRVMSRDTAVAGWFGWMSLVATPVTLWENRREVARARTLPRRGPEYAESLGDAELALLLDHTATLDAAARGALPLHTTVNDVASRSGLAPVRAYVFVANLRGATVG